VITVVIADDHELIRDGMRKLIEQESDVTLAGEASNAEELMNLLRSKEVDVAVLDIGLPDKNGIEVLKDVRAESIESRVLVLSIHPEKRYAQRALRNGASGYLTKDRASETIVSAVRAVYEKGSYITEGVAEELYRSMGTARPAAPHECLSDREYQIFLSIGAGKAVRDIAEELGISVNTVHTYRRRILEKTGFSSDAEIVRYAARNDLL
jgi:DNA-binding NarL/FixJ family response regulator